MSLLSRYYNRKFMQKALELRAKDSEYNPWNELKSRFSKRSLLSSDETYESVTSGFFAKEGELSQKPPHNSFF